MCMVYNSLRYIVDDSDSNEQNDPSLWWIIHLLMRDN